MSHITGVSSASVSKRHLSLRCVFCEVQSEAKISRALAGWGWVGVIQWILCFTVGEIFQIVGALFTAFTLGQVSRHRLCTVNDIVQNMIIIILISVHFNSYCFYEKREYAKLTASRNRFGTPDIGLLTH